MKKQLFLLFGFIIFNFGNAQNCLEFDLSKTYDFDIMLVSKDDKDLGKAEIIIGIHDKIKLKKIQRIKIESEFILKSKSFKECLNNKKYSANEFLKSNENDFGDLIVTDLNFDGKEDIAIKREEGGNGGPIYNFYIQNENQQFVLDKYLSHQMLYFPDYIDSEKKTLHVYVRVNSLSEEGITYSYSEITKKWNVEKKVTYRN
ncbi:XAC2610-related protein [Flavobacterium dankookense]|uniref:VCBS repeat-containing protein n=1 Tax=Flavobacterium dankookense TaxID=706186 RepID=A0A4R6QAJ8_9FLAO|nr:hypothetical protein [Flavobacterium dankookense]TDP59381.1 hypothetical protein BC748_1630 [Flavobacterium dankookense]